MKLGAVPEEFRDHLQITHLNLLQPGVAFLNPLKTSGFLMFSGGIEKQHWAVMG